MPYHWFLHSFRVHFTPGIDYHPEFSIWLHIKKQDKHMKLGKIGQHIIHRQDEIGQE